MVLGLKKHRDQVGTSKSATVQWQVHIFNLFAVFLVELQDPCSPTAPTIAQTAAELAAPVDPQAGQAQHHKKAIAQK